MKTLKSHYRYKAKFLKTSLYWIIDNSKPVHDTLKFINKLLGFVNFGQPKIHKLGAPIRPVVSFYKTPLSALHKVLAHYLKPLANSSIRLKDTNDFKQHLNTTGHPNFPYHTSLDIKSLYTSCDNKKSLSTTILHFQDKPHLLPPNISASTIQSSISVCLDNSYFEFLNSTASSTHKTLEERWDLHLW